jgi:hypothetical protein
LVALKSQRERCYLQHARIHGQEMQQRVLSRQQAMLVVEKSIFCKRGGLAEVCQPWGFEGHIGHIAAKGIARLP